MKPNTFTAALFLACAALLAACSRPASDSPGAGSASERASTNSTTQGVMPGAKPFERELPPAPPSSSASDAPQDDKDAVSR